MVIITDMVMELEGRMIKIIILNACHGEPVEACGEKMKEGEEKSKIN